MEQIEILPSLAVNSSNFYGLTTILHRGNAILFLYGFCCSYNATECFLGILLYQNRPDRLNGVINKPQLVWSANRNHPVKANATLQLGQDGNSVTDSDGTLVWSTNTTGKSVSGLKFDRNGNLNLVSGRKLQASVSASNWSQGLFSFTLLHGSFAAYTDTDPPQYYVSDYPDSPYFSFDGRTLTALHYPTTSTAQFIKLGPDGHLKVYQWSVIDWDEVYDILAPYVRNWGNCAYQICTRNRELENTTYFAFNINHELISSRLWLEGKKLEDCKRACLSNCSCKAAVFEYDWNGNERGSCLLLNEVFSLIDDGRRQDKDFSKLEEGGFGLYMKRKLSNGTKIAVKQLDGLGQVKESFLTEVKTVGGIHHINLVKLIGFCAEKSHRLLIYEITWGTRGYLAPEWTSSVITEKVDVYAFGIVLLETLCGRKNLDWSQADEEDVHLLSVFRRKAEQGQLMDIVDKNNEDMQLHREAVTEMMSLAAWCLQGILLKRPSISLLVKSTRRSSEWRPNSQMDATEVSRMNIMENLQHVVVEKFSYDWPNIEELRTTVPTAVWLKRRL
ncbi:hypothetical protein HAX54_027796 [Datura stramonium]|uniref:Uncharacterized protein n=1 Tax=Datura stramonium TaxID=4076 RepID=A0ABS8V3C5_DATST|nr:hypothetical protein [Datura stramonium]